MLDASVAEHLDADEQPISPPIGSISSLASSRVCSHATASPSGILTEDGGLRDLVASPGMPLLQGEDDRG
jgi:hypothetical protein